MFEPEKTLSGPEATVLYPVSGTGFMFLLLVTLCLGVVRFTVWTFASDLAGLSSAGVLIFDLMAAAYLSRYLLVAVESAAEGYDLAPSPPNPMEAELVFGALLKILVALLFAALPLIIAVALGVDGGLVPIFLLVLGSVYLPMAILGIAMTGDISGALPGTVFSAILTVPARYFRAALIAVLGGIPLILSWTDLMPNLPLVVKVGFDAIGAWFLLMTLHRMGVIYREEFTLRAVMPVPQTGFMTDEIATPPRPVSDIERILEERKMEERDRTPIK